MPPERSGPSLVKVLYNRLLRRLSSLPLAIGELAVIALLSAIGTIIEQHKGLEYYMEVRSLSQPGTACPVALLVRRVLSSARVLTCHG